MKTLQLKRRRTRVKKTNLNKFKDNNMLAKILSLVIAILLWSYVMGVENPNESITIRNVRVNFQNMESLEQKGLILLSPSEQFVNIKISGKKNDLDKIRQGSIYATADLEGYGVGDSRVRVDTRFESNPGTVQVESVSPRDVLVSIDRVITREMAVKIDTNGSPLENYIIGDITTSSPHVKIKGPQHVLDKVRSLVASVDITDKTEPFTVSNPVKAVDENGEELVSIETTPNVIDISVPIFKTVIMPIELKTTGTLPTLVNMRSYDITPKTITLKVLNDTKIPKSIETEPIDLSTLKGNTSQEVKLNIPEGVMPVDENVKYNLNILLDNFAIRRVEIAKSQIHFTNLPEGLELDDASVEDVYTVDISGEESKVTNFDEKKLKLFCDMGNALPGVQKYELQVEKNPDNIVLNSPVTIDLKVVEKENEQNDNNESTDEKENDKNDEKRE